MKIVLAFAILTILSGSTIAIKSTPFPVLNLLYKGGLENLDKIDDDVTKMEYMLEETAKETAKIIKHSISKLSTVLGKKSGQYLNKYIRFAQKEYISQEKASEKLNLNVEECVTFLSPQKSISIVKNSLNACRNKRLAQTTEIVQAALKQTAGVKKELEKFRDEIDACLDNVRTVFNSPPAMVCVERIRIQTHRLRITKIQTFGQTQDNFENVLKSIATSIPSCIQQHSEKIIKQHAIVDGRKVRKCIDSQLIKYKKLLDAMSTTSTTSAPLSTTTAAALNILEVFDSTENEIIGESLRNISSNSNIAEVQRPANISQKQKDTKSDESTTSENLAEPEVSEIDKIKEINDSEIEKAISETVDEESDKGNAMQEDGNSSDENAESAEMGDDLEMLNPRE